jgi:hypothetical protein
MADLTFAPPDADGARPTVDPAAAGEVTAAAGGFDRKLWERLAPALPEATE